MNKRILIISPYFPYPPHNGGKARLYNLLRQLARRNEIFLLSYIDTLHSNEYVPAIEELGVRVFTVPRDESKGINGEQLPRSIGSFYTPSMIEKLEDVMEMIRPDLVQIDSLVMLQYVNHAGCVPAVYAGHDMSSISFEQSLYDRDLPEKMRFVEWSKLLRFQRALLPKFRSIVVQAERDRKLLDEFAPGLPSMLVPTGVDLAYFRPPKVPVENADILFVGCHQHLPNYDAVNHFVKEIFPRIAEEIPATRFLTVGSGMKKDLAALGGKNVQVIGEVADVRCYLGTACVFVAPVRLGGGGKGKILEAMASGLPVVATKEASAGIDVRPGFDIEIAKDETDFAAKVITLLRDPGRRRTMAYHARRLVEQHYDWEKIGARLDNYYDSIIGALHC